MKIKVNMLSKADSVEGQGVGSAYQEQVALLKEYAKDDLEIMINSREKCDIIHCHSVNPSFYGRMKSRYVSKVAYVHFLPDTLDGSIKLPRILFRIFKRYVINFYRRADFLVVVNNAFIDELVKYNIPAERIRYIPNYVSSRGFFKVCTDVRSKFGIEKDKFVVLGVGQIQHRKGVLDFVEIAKKNPNMTFVWAGGFSFGKITDGYQELKKVCDNPPANLQFLGIVKREEMNAIYNMADVLFMPSYSELFPMSILEACSVGKPFVLRDLKLYEDIFFNDYLRGSNNDEFADILIKLKNDKDFYKRGLDIASRVNEYYSEERISRMWVEFYREVLEKKR